MTKVLLDDSWALEPTVAAKLQECATTLSPKQLKLMTPVFINSTTLEILKEAYTSLFKQSGTLYTPSAFRYSYSFRVKGKNIMATTLYHLERDFTLMLTKYNIVVHTNTLKLSGAAWEREAYTKLKYFTYGCARAQHKLIKTKDKSDLYVGWYFDEVFPDKPA